MNLAWYGKGTMMNGKEHTIMYYDTIQYNTLYNNSIVQHSIAQHIIEYVVYYTANRMMLTS